MTDANSVSETNGCDQPKFIVRQITASERDIVISVMTASFLDESSIQYVFADKQKVARWSPLMHGITFDLAASMGFITGAWTNTTPAADSAKLVGVATWSLHRFSSLPLRLTLKFLTTYLYLICMQFPAAMRWMWFGHVHESLLPRRESFWMLYGLGVLPEFRNQGIGSLLVDDGVKRLTTARRRICLTCSSNLKPFYERRGFELIAERPFRGNAETACAMGRMPNPAAAGTVGDTKCHSHAEERLPFELRDLAGLIVTMGVCLIVCLFFGPTGAGAVIGGSLGSHLGYAKRESSAWTIVGFAIGMIVGAVLGLCIEFKIQAK